MPGTQPVSGEGPPPAGDPDQLHPLPVDPLLLEELLTLATDLAHEAGELVAAHSRSARTSVRTKSSATDMVTDVDRDSEALIIRRLQAARPDDAVLGEEGGGQEGTSGVRWIIDPLDGTTNYLYRFPAFAVSVAAEMRGEIVVAAVRDATRGETYTAAKGRGAALDGHPIEVSDHVELATALVGTGFSYQPTRRVAQAQLLVRLLPLVRDVRRAGSAALDLCFVACGRLDGFYEHGLQPWDLAGGDLIVREAGGLTASLGPSAPPGDPRGRSLVAAGPALFESLLALLEELGAGEV